MATENRNAIDEAQIRSLLEARVKAVRARDLNGVMFNIAPDILSFDVVNPLQCVGAKALRKHVEEWFALLQGRIGYEIWDLSITTGDDIAFSHSLNRIMATTPDGKQIDMYWRATVCCCKIAGKWLITHEHNSVPFDPASGKASQDLKP